MSADSCLEAVERAIARCGGPEIFNGDHGTQFTSIDFVGVLRQHGIRISMQDRGVWRDNVFAEELWKSVKYE
jgi:putative transposase